MKKFLLSLVLFTGLLVGLTGCTVVETPEEHSRRLGVQLEIQMREIVEDFDYVWLFERESRLTMWHPRVGFQ